MKASPLFCLVCFAAPLLAPALAVVPDTVPVLFGTTVKRSVTIELGYPIYTLVAPVFRAPTPVVVGSEVRLVAPGAPEGLSSVRWFRDGVELPQTGSTLVIPAATRANAGTYYARVSVERAAERESDSITLHVSSGLNRLVNVSAMLRISEQQPRQQVAFYVEPGPDQAVVLVRAVGPALAPFGVPNPLEEPRLRVFNASGAEVTGGYPWFDPEHLARLAGAFPIPAGGKDVARGLMLPAGAYTLELSSENGGSGTALLEVYQVTP